MKTQTIFRALSTFDHNMMTRISKPDVSETDVSPKSKKMNIQKKPHRYLAKPDKIARSYKGGRYGLCHDNPTCVDIS